MRTLLRRIPTGLFFQGPDKWTSDPAEALNFKSIDRALEFVQTWQMKEMELAFAFNDVPSITRVPLEKMATKYSQD
jgi:hypothetical protein